MSPRRSPIRSLAALAFIGLSGISIWPAAAQPVDRGPFRLEKPRDPLSKETKALLDGLDANMSVAWDNVLLRDAFDSLKKELGLNIVVRDETWRNASLDANRARVTLKAENASARFILRKILCDHELDYLLKQDGKVYIATAQQALEQMVTRLYPIADLLPADAKIGPFMDPNAAGKDAEKLIEAIKQRVDPEIWKSPGPAIQFFAPARCLVIHAPAEAHFLLHREVTKGLKLDPGKPDNQDAAKIAEIEKRLAQQIETTHFQEPMPFAKFLAKLEAVMPENQKVSLRTHDEAFGKDLKELLSSPIVLSPFPKKTSLTSMLRMAMAQMDMFRGELDYRIFPSHFAITTRKHSAYTAVHDIGECVREVLPKLRRMNQRVPDWDWSAMKPGKEADYLARLILNTVTYEPAPTRIEIQNGARLIAHTNHNNHLAIRDLVDSLQRFADLAVVMNARLIEVDGNFYDTHIAPRFAVSKREPDGRTLARVNPEFVKMLEKHKPILQGDLLKVLPGEPTVFLSMQHLTSYVAPDNTTGKSLFRTGVSFTVKAAISADRRRMELHIAQDAAELVEIKKVKVLNVKTGKEVDAESPNVRKTSLTGAMVIEDTQAILMPVPYRSAAAKQDGRRWVMLAVPMIYIEEEVKQLGIKDITPTPREDDDPEPEKPIKRPPAPARSEKVDQLLHALVKDVLTNPEVNDFDRLFPGTKIRKFQLVDGASLSWPEWFQPSVPGFTRYVPDPDKLELNPPVEIRLERFDLKGKQKPRGEFDTPIAVVFHDRRVIRGLWVHYVPKKEGKRWTVQLHGVHSP